MAARKGSESSLTTNNENAVEKATPYQRFLLKLESEAAFSEVDGSTLMADTIESMLMAESLEAAAAAMESGLMSAKDHMVDVPHQVNAIQVRKSTKGEEGSFPFYLVVDAVRFDTGEAVTYSVGAPYVFTLLYRAFEEDRLPVSIIIKLKPTNSGNDVMLAKIIKSPVINVSDSPGF